MMRIMKSNINPVVMRRARLGWTMAFLARRAGVRVATINDIEKGHKTPRVSTIGKVAKAMNLELAALLSYFHGKRAAK